ncbi:unnamed protein product [Lactuca saligna]|uniref:Uncharacterized protein n=1 Tax=Lactuca saligna TaxID=75948 RepID=A0AA36E9A7_LACSI|nr:unnamed protein product [Lactuca saligna]
MAALAVSLEFLCSATKHVHAPGTQHHRFMHSIGELVAVYDARRDEGGERWPYREHSVRTRLVSAGHSSDFIIGGVSSAVHDFTKAAKEVTMAFNDKVAEARMVAPGGLARSETGRVCAVCGFDSKPHQTAPRTPLEHTHIQPPTRWQKIVGTPLNGNQRRLRPQTARRDEGGERCPYSEHSVHTRLVSAGHNSDFVLSGVSSAVRDFTGAAEEVTMTFNDKVAEARIVAPGSLTRSETRRKYTVGGLTSGRREIRRWWRL